MTRTIQIGLLRVTLKLTPAIAQSSCLTLSEGLRRFNEANNSPASIDRALPDKVAIFTSSRAETNVTDCVRSGSVFLHACEQRKTR
jgi:hypothetical protein